MTSKGSFKMVMKFKSLLYIFVFISIVFILNSCMPGGGSSSTPDPAGFLMGVWHGWIAPLSLIFGLFEPSIRVYESFNTGWWYDFGFYIAVISGFGGLSLIRKKSKK